MIYVLSDSNAIKLSLLSRITCTFSSLFSFYFTQGRKEKIQKTQRISLLLCVSLSRLCGMKYLLWIPVIIYIMGVSGSGKTTIGKKLAAKIGLPFFDGDDFHPPSNKEKMKRGIPLTDDDRKDWLIQMNNAAMDQAKLTGAVIACSALERKIQGHFIIRNYNPIVLGISSGKF